MTVDANTIALFKAELELCKVGVGEVVAVLSEGVARQDYAQAFLTAAQELGAGAFHVNLAPKVIRTSALHVTGKPSLAGNQPAIDALKSADIVIDLMGLLFSPEQLEITNSGTRVLLVIETIDVLRQMFPTPDLRRRVEFAGKLLSNAKEMRITSKSGTDIRYGLSQYPVLTEYGYTDEPGRWDHWPSGFLLTQGNDEDVEGTVVLAAGDIITRFNRYVQSPVTMKVERGRVVSIDGEGMDAELLKSYIDSFNDDRAYATSHIGWGLNERANWHQLAASRSVNQERGVNGLAFYGNVLFSMGPNVEVGGKNDTACHIDIPLRNCSLSLDNEMIVEHGRIVPPEMRVPGR